MIRMTTVHIGLDIYSNSAHYIDQTIHNTPNTYSYTIGPAVGDLTIGPAVGFLISHAYTDSLYSENQ